ncbi:HtaA domain-containing protein [Cellulomonas biazotea]|uniref:Htaa domain-containing protein n=1 Tax=Cellulomonas biazotea TaxID=1709 RepID=A0A402DQB2_9CELL|nr:HtaA domain-containing protein [Cellulomonas biazotea]GCE76323.1 hypothetical protein CBZ_13790 [Cellulomonas biazotea]
MHTARTRGRRAAVVGLTALAVGLGGVAVGLPAQAAAGDPTDGTLEWGFRQSFRNYVGRQTAALPPIGAVPVGQRITVLAPAQFDVDGTPAVPENTATPNETLPYLLPVTGGSVTSADDLRVESAGGAVFAFPSHAFTVTVTDVAVVVSGGVGSLVGDLSVVIPENNLGYTAGTYGGDDVVLGTVTDVDVTLTAQSVTVSGTGVALTADGAAALQNFLQEGAALDDFTVTADRESATAPVWSPQITVSKTSGFDPAGTETVTVTGTGFDPAANLATGRPPVANGQPTGVYVAFGRFADVWRPSAGAASAARPVTSQKWALPEPSYTQVGTDYPSQAPALVVLQPDGSFTAQLDVKAAAQTTGTYGVYVFAAGGAAANAAQELFVPLSFAGDLDVDVTVPETPVDPGAFSWTVAGSGAVSLGTATAGDAAFTAVGALPAITVSDTRPASPGWSITGSTGRFASADGTASFPGSRLGWAPHVTGSVAAAGAAVAPAASGGLAAGSTLAFAPAGSTSGAVTAGADLTLSLPLDTPAGAYSGVLTLTAVG